MFKSRFAPVATLLLVAVAIAGAFGVAATTHADQVYHSERLVLSPTNLNDGGTGLCRGEIAQVIDTSQGFTVGSCSIGDFVPYTGRGRRV